MKAAVFYGTNDLRILDVPRPKPGAWEVLLRVHTTGLCMTDLHILQGHFPVQPPRILGHELTGVVEAVGPGVLSGWMGQTVGVSPARFCGHCAACQQGAPQLCANFECLGNTSDGGFAEYVVVRADQLVQLGKMSPARAVWMEPLACVLHAVEAACPSAEGTVLVSGAGTLGQLMVQALRMTRNARVAVVDPNPAKIEATRRFGAEAGWVVPRSGTADDTAPALREWAANGLSAIIETSGKPLAFDRAIRWAGPQTRVVLFGVSDPQAHAALPLSVLLAKELNITAASGMTPATFAAATKLLTDTALDTAALVDQTVDLDGISAALERMRRGSAGKILIQPH
ncbi:MAG: alcohol dehydrogenase catalytic domain-containing protein [Anaerolineae bacterium]|nr:alcohol dehydrogenase catalytic domain-containing protein [Anaerolineae bacterium]